MQNIRSHGFTLIELLVVIAIIGVLSAVVLASLNTARNKGNDAAIKANLSGARVEAELFYDPALTYNAVCALTGTNVIGDNINAADKVFDGTAPASYADGTAATATNGACHDAPDTWVAEVPLKAGGFFCVDYTGTAKETATAITANATVCP
ncbi:MAG: type II secretion system protein [bacterium]|nr:type II secretion system protein [bacterium]